MEAFIHVEGKHCFVCSILGFICLFEPEEVYQGGSHDLHLPICKLLPQANTGPRLIIEERLVKFKLLPKKHDIDIPWLNANVIRFGGLDSLRVDSTFYHWPYIFICYFFWTVILFLWQESRI